MPRTCTICRTPFEGFGGHCPDCVEYARRERARQRAEADRRNALHVWRVDQERRQRRSEQHFEWTEEV